MHLNTSQEFSRSCGQTFSARFSLHLIIILWILDDIAIRYEHTHVPRVSLDGANCSCWFNLMRSCLKGLEILLMIRNYGNVSRKVKTRDKNIGNMMNGKADIGRINSWISIQLLCSLGINRPNPYSHGY